MTKNTILVVASSPGFPHGVMDHVKDIAQVWPRFKPCLMVTIAEARTVKRKESITELPTYRVLVH